MAKFENYIADIEEHVLLGVKLENAYQIREVKGAHECNSLLPGQILTNFFLSFSQFYINVI